MFSSIGLRSVRSAATLLASSALLLPASTGRADGGDSFAAAFVLPSGVLEITDFLSAVEPRDLLLGARDAAGGLFATDDNSSPLGDGTAPALFGMDVNPAGGIRFDVTGHDDSNFSGFHDTSAVYQALVTVRDGPEIGAGVLHEQTILNFLQPSSVTPQELSDPDWAGGVFDVVINNFPTGFASDVDYFRFTGLTPGEAFSAQVAPAGAESFGLEGAILGWLTAPGAVEAATDTDLIGGGSNPRFAGFVPESGEVVLAVSAEIDFGFVGVHTSTGQYRLELSLGSPLAGDYEQDLDVDGADYALWSATYGSTGPGLAADGNGDGAVDAADYTVWRDHLVRRRRSTAVPEPGALAAVAMALGLMAARRRRG